MPDSGNEYRVNGWLWWISFRNSIMDIGFAEKERKPSGTKNRTDIWCGAGNPGSFEPNGWDSEYMEKWSYKEESYIKSNARRNIYQKLDIYISGIRFYGAKDSEDVLQDGTNAMHDQRTRNRWVIYGTFDELFYLSLFYEILWR